MKIHKLLVISPRTSVITLVSFKLLKAKATTPSPGSFSRSNTNSSKAGALKINLPAWLAGNLIVTYLCIFIVPSCCSCNLLNTHPEYSYIINLV